jgi:5-methylcytosine-specific restriction endonuclease McrA
MFEIVDGMLIEKEAKVVTNVQLKKRWNLGKVSKAVPTDTSFQRVSIGNSGYEVIYQPDHPISPIGGKVFRHRVIVYDLIGPGWHSCTHCGVDVTWDAHCPEPQALVVDHMDWNRSNNGLSNLVISCQPCNLKRKKPRG